MKVLVLGGYGAVGSRLVTELRRSGDDVVVAGRDPARADLTIDLAEHGLSSLRAALPGVRVLVNASGAEDPRLADLAGQHGSAFVDVTATTGYISQLEALSPAGPVAVDVGLAPGLTNLLASAVHRDARGPIDLAVFLGAGERHGPAAIEWSYRLLGRHFHHRGRTIRNYSQPKSFPLPGHGRRRLYRLDFSDQHTLTRDLAVSVRTYFGLDSRLATAALAALTWMPGAAHAPRGLHLPGTDAWMVLAVGHDGSTRWARGNSQSRATAVMAAMATHAAVKSTPGVHYLHRLLTLDDVPAGRGIELNDTAGTADRARRSALPADDGGDLRPPATIAKQP